jgi:hypothetical protein
MAHREKKVKALEMRRNGASYSMIKEQVGVSKSTLSLWLRDMPLTEERIRELRDFSETRIERTRETKRRKKEARLEGVRKTVKEKIAKLSEREIFLAGLFLYWGEGGKTKETNVVLSNTDPSMIKFYIKWLELLGVPKDRLKIRINLYSDMNIEEEMTYWSEKLHVPLSQFRKPYMKESRRTDITYTQKFTHGTCNVIYENRDVAELVLQSLSEIQSIFAE